MPHEHHILRGARDVAAALTTAARSPIFEPAEADILVGAASALWRAREVLRDALDDPAPRLRRLHGTPTPVAASAPPQREGPPLATAERARRYTEKLRRVKSLA
jgi:hypothetical protein